MTPQNLIRFAPSLHRSTAILAAMALLAGCPQQVPDDQKFSAGTTAGTADSLGSLPADTATATAADTGTGTDATPADTATSDGASWDAGPKTCTSAADCGPNPGPCKGWQCQGICYEALVNSGPCDDGDPCTAGDVCFAGVCQVAGPTSCDDGNPCTKDSCAAPGGCAHTNLADGTDCGGGKTCQSAGCVGGVGSGVQAVTAAAYLTCEVVKGSGKPFCWGEDTKGQVGTGSTGGKWFFSPQPVKDLTGVTDIDCGANHCCAITAKGLFCWGNDEFGEVSALGKGGKPVNAPLQVLVPATQVAVGEYHTCALDSVGTVRCWGLGSSGQLGDGDSTVGAPPVVVQAGVSISQLDCGRTYCCGVVAGGGVSCWGLNMSGQMGTGISGPSSMQYTPKPAKGVIGALQVATGAEHACALIGGGKVMCWGANGSHQTGLTGTSSMATPGLVPGLSSVTALSAGGSHTCAMVGTQLWCWGANGKAQAVPGSKSLIIDFPTQVTAMPNVAGLALGDDHTCVYTETNALFCWGSNNLGQVGNGTNKDVPTPLQVQ